MKVQVTKREGDKFLRPYILHIGGSSMNDSGGLPVDQFLADMNEAEAKALYQALGEALEKRNTRKKTKNA